MVRGGRRKRWLFRASVALAFFAVVVMVVLVIRSFLAEAGTKKPMVQRITLVKPPPPPPPPKVEEKPPEVKKEEVKLPEPEKQPDQPPVQNAPEAKALGLDAEGGAGSDAFGLIGNKGGRDLIGASGSRFAWYAGLIQQQIQQVFTKNKKLQASEYKVMVNIWFRPDGSVQRSELLGSTGKPDTDESIRLALSALAPLKEPPPPDMPQPIKLRVSNRY